MIPIKVKRVMPPKSRMQSLCKVQMIRLPGQQFSHMFQPAPPGRWPPGELIQSLFGIKPAKSGFERLIESFTQVIIDNAPFIANGILVVGAAFLVGGLCRWAFPPHLPQHQTHGGWGRRFVRLAAILTLAVALMFGASALGRRLEAEVYIDRHVDPFFDGLERCISLMLRELELGFRRVPSFPWVGPVTVVVWPAC